MPMWISKFRRSKKARLTIIGVLFLIVLALLVFWGKAKILLIALLILLAVAFGVESYDYDIDLWKFMETWNYQESRIENKNGVKLIGRCVSNDLNCSNFDNQAEAQELFNECAIQIKQNNPGIENVDVYGLDGDKDGLVCESLRKTAE